MKKTKKSLVLSIVTLLLCSCMFIGSTFAWFTDTVSNTGNKIQAGTLDIGLEKWDGTKFEDISDSTDPIFNYDKWEPGYSEIVGLKVVNKGTLALKYMINIVANGDASKLAEAIDVYSKIVAPTEEFALPEKFDDVKTNNTFKVTPLTEVLSYAEGAAHGALLASQDSAEPDGTKLEAKESASMIIVLHMKEEAGNEYQGLSLGSTFDINVFATQYTHEKDGFGSDQYDIDTPWMGEVAETLPFNEETGVYEISNGSQLAKLSKIVKTTEGRSELKGKTVKLVKDIDLNNVSFTPICQGTNDTSWIFDGNNKTIINLKIEGQKGVGLFTYCPGLTVKNLTVDHANVTGINQVGVIAGNGTCIKIDKCMVKDAKVTTLVANNDDGDKAGAIVGYLCADSGTNNAQVTNCNVENSVIQGYRDIGGAIGMLNGPSVATGNKVTKTTIICDNSINYNKYTNEEQHNAHEIVGRKSDTCTDENNSPVNCKVYFINKIQDLVDKLVEDAQPGDEIVLPASNEPIDLPAINVDNLTIAGNGEETVVKTSQKGTTKLQKENLVLKDLTLELGDTSSTDGAVNVNKKTSFENVTFTYDESAPKFAIMVSGNEDVEFINCKFNMEGKTRGIMVWGSSAKITIDGCYFDCVYPFNVDGGSPEFIVKNSTLNGWTSYTTTAKASFTDCKFGKSTSGYEYCRPYSNTTFTYCEFSSDFLADLGAEGVALTFNNCKQNGSPVTKNIIEPKFQASGKVIIDGTEYTFTKN